MLFQWYYVKLHSKQIHLQWGNGFSGICVCMLGPCNNCLSTLQPSCETPAQNCIKMQIGLIMKKKEEEWWWGRSNYYKCFSARLWDVNKALWLPSVTVIRWIQCLTLSCYSSTAPCLGPFFYLVYFFYCHIHYSSESPVSESSTRSKQRTRSKNTDTQFSSYIGSIGRESVHILKPKCIAGVVGSIFTVCSSASHYIYPGGEPQDALECHFNTSKLAYHPYIVQRYWSICHRKVQYINSTLNHQRGYNNNDDNCFVFLCQLVFKGQKATF